MSARESIRESRNGLRTPERVPETPPGWSYNPSAWQERIPLIALALAGFCIATYLSLYQYGVFDSIWEPFFGAGSRIILNSSLSNVLPVPDAVLGAAAYLADAVTGAIGGKQRWKSMPWMVILFGLAVGPLGAVSILLVILQPVFFGVWCTLCLISAVISVTMIGPAMDETLASLQYLKRVRAQGKSLWKAFWGSEQESPADETPHKDGRR